MHRRRFLGTSCSLAGAAVGTLLPATIAGAATTPRLYRRARLVGADGQPLKASALAAYRTYVFHYPYAGTPCFLLNLGRPTAPAAELKTAASRPYEWRGGVGAGRSIVAYSAICSHQLTYPTREISFISYREQPTPHSRHARVIHCCSEHSQYDPARGAQVLAGPAPQPLAAILLEHDAKSDELAAIGAQGGEMFDVFFDKFALRLELEHGGRARRPIDGECAVTELGQYCRQQVKC